MKTVYISDFWGAFQYMVEEYQYIQDYQGKSQFLSSPDLHCSFCLKVPDMIILKN